MRARREKRSANSQIGNIYKNRKRNIAIVILIAFCLFIIYKINFLTKSEENVKLTSIKFTEYDTNSVLNDDVGMYEDENGTYIVLPEKVKGLYAQKYYILDNANEEKSEDTKKDDKNGNEIVQNVVQEIQNTVENTSVQNIIENKVTENTTNSLISKAFQANNKKFLAEKTEDNIENTQNENVIVDDKNNDSNKNENTITNSTEESQATVENKTSENTTIDNKNTVSNTISNTVENNQKNTNTSENNTKTDLTQNKVSENNVEDKNIENDNTEIDINGKSYLPGEKVYIDKKILDKDKAEFVVVYQTIEINNTKLYKQELNAEDNSVNIKVTGYIPLEYSLNVTSQDDNTINELREGVKEFEESDILVAYDIKIVNGEKEYQPKDYYQIVQVEFNSEEQFSGKIKKVPVQVVHIAENDAENSINFEKISLQDKTEDTLEFSANEFSTYVVFTSSSIQKDKINIYDYDSDYNYYTGKNYTDNDEGINQKNYTDDTLAKVTVNYYGYDYSKNLDEQTTFSITPTWNNVSNSSSYGYTNYNISITANSSSAQIIDNNSNWTMKFTLPTNVGQYFNITRTAGNNNGLDISFDSNTNIVTVSASNWNNWTQNSLTSYQLNLVLTFSQSVNINSVSNLSITAVEKYIVGYTSADTNERQCLYSYVKCMPITNGNVSFDLIDNPYMDRPAGFGFDGWTTNESGYNISINSNTKVQTLTTSLNGKKEIEINLYANWKEANIVFINTNNGSDSTNGNVGLTINNPVRTWNNVNSILTRNYKNAQNASNRELNIVVFTGGTLENLNTITTAYTLTSLYDGTDYRSNATLNFRTSVTLSSDLQLDFLKMIGYSSSNSNNSYYYTEGTSNVNYYLCGNTYNLRIGRGMIVNNNNQATIAQVQGGPSGKTNSEYKIVIESGKYSNIQVARASNAGTYTSFATLVAGNDFDRIAENNDNLKVYYRMASRTSSGYVNSYNGNPVYIMNVKSGTFGHEYWNNYRNSEDMTYAGIYLGGHGYTNDDNGDRILIVEGGEITNIIGGLSTSSGTAVKTKIYVKGGNIQNIVAGAGVSQTYGDRFIQVTGGNVAYSVSGGSNGYHASSTQNNGKLDGNSLIYIGGDAVIGTNDSTSTLYGVEAGCVLGAGNGNSSYSASVKSSHIIVDGNAKIFNNVYGGGNYGYVGESSNSGSDSGNPVVEFSNESNNIVSGEKYIIANGSNINSNEIIANGTSISNKTLSNTSIPSDTEQWIVEKSGSGYTIKNSSTGRYLYARRDGGGRNPRITLTLNTTATVFTYSNNRLSYSYNGTTYYLYATSSWNWSDYDYTYSWQLSNYYSTNVYFLKYKNIKQDGSEADPLDTKTTIDIYGGTIGNNVYGGANQNNIYGSVDINMYNGSVSGTIYGGSNTKGTISGVTDLNIEGGIIGSADNLDDVIFGGGKGQNTSVSQYSKINITDNSNNVYLYGNIYGGSALGAISGNSYVDIKDTSSEQNSITINGNVYGGGKGDTNTSAISRGNTNVTIDGGDYQNVKAFGGCNINGSIGGTVNVKIGENNETVLNEVYGGGNQATITNETQGVYVYLYENSKATNAFNGGNSAGIDETNENTPREINIQGATVENVYGGSNESGSLKETHVNISSGTKNNPSTVENVYGGGYGNQATIDGNTNVKILSSNIGTTYGGGNAGTVKGNTDVNSNSSTITTAVYGGGKSAEVSGTTNVEIESSTTGDVYGGGEDGSVTDNSNNATNIEINSSSINTVYGGGKGETANVSGTTNINVTSTTNNVKSQILDTIYGGGNAGAVKGDTNVSLDNVEVENCVYGGGKGETAEVSGTTNTIVENSQIGDCVYGGGDAGKVSTDAVVTISNSDIIYNKNKDTSGNIYGGGNQAEVGGSTSVYIEDSSTNEVYGGGNQGKIGNSTSVSIIRTNIESSVYGGGNQGEVSGNTLVSVSNQDAKDDNNLPEVKGSIYGGGKSANVNGTTVNLISNAKTQNVYGGGDQGEVVENTTVKIVDSTIKNAVYGGGNGAESQTAGKAPGKVGGNTSVDISATTNNIANNKYVKTSYVFGGGKGTSAYVNGDTNVTLKEGTKVIEDDITSNGGDVYGGGDNGYVNGSTTVELKSPIISGSVYAAGNGSKAIVYTNSYVYSEGTTQIDENLFGGGNAAATGKTGDITSKAIVDIAGGIIKGHVFGGANSSVVNGDTIVNIGNEAINTYHGNDKGYIQGNINIDGTIYGGGYSMSDNPDKWNEDAISVTNTITINVYGDNYDVSNNGTTYELNIGGSIFGSGNASNAASDGNITIKNYGTESKRKKLVSIQRSGTTNINNSVLIISGIKDSTSDYKETPFVFNKIADLQLQNNSILYLKNGTNRLSKFESLDKNGNYATATIADDYKVTTTADNRLYMANGVNFNVCYGDPQKYEVGPVKGMTFFGIFTSMSEGENTDPDGIYKGIYDQSYVTGGKIDSYTSREFIRTYVYGEHTKTPSEQDVTKDGFYTNMELLDEGYEYGNINANHYSATSYTAYIDPTPKGDYQYYYWYAGPDQEIYTYDIELVASKFSTLGSYENPFSDMNFPDATLTMTSVDSTQLSDKVELVSKNDIENINNDNTANTKFALAMKSGNTGWSTKGSTDFYRTNYSGDTVYQFENAQTTPSMSFFFYHSNNITENQTLGTYRVMMDLTYWKSDGLNRGTAKVIFNISIFTKKYDGVGYNAAITPGTQYDLFTSSQTNITTKSSFSTYFEMGEQDFFTSLEKGVKESGVTLPEQYTQKDDNGIPIYYKNSYRTISSGKYVFPENTTITMIDRYDKNNPTYYYYIVTAQDVVNKKTEYKLTEFLSMGSTNKYYDESAMKEKYYLQDSNYQYENFIFIVNLEGADFSNYNDGEKITPDNNYFEMFLKFDYTIDSESATMNLAEIINDQKGSTGYGIYKSDSTIGVKANLSKTKIYLGNDVSLNVTTTYDASTQTAKVLDTRYFDKKLGVKLTFYYKGENGQYTKVNGGTTLGTYFGLTKNGVDNYYYPRSDGTTRIKIAELVSNSSSSIDFITKNSTLPTGEYKILVEVFGSADGIYYGIEASASTEIQMQIINDSYGLKSSVAEDRQAIIDSKTGQITDSEGYVQDAKYIENTSVDADGNTVTTKAEDFDNKLKFLLDYQSGLSNPYITVSLYRRDYDSKDNANPDLYERTYTLVDFQDYVQDKLTVPTEMLSSYNSSDEAENEYIKSITKLENEYEAVSTSKIKATVVDNTVSVTFDDLEYTLKQKLKTGTYKVVFTLYDTTDTTAIRNIMDSEGQIISQKSYNVREYEKIGDAFSYIIIK